MGQVVCNYLLAAFYVLADFAAAWLVGWLAVRKLPALASDGTRAVTFLVGSGLLLVAAIGRLGWSIQTIAGVSPPENLDQGIFLILSLCGTFLLIYNFVVGWLAR